MLQDFRFPSSPPRGAPSSDQMQISYRAECLIVFPKFQPGGSWPLSFTYVIAGPCTTKRPTPSDDVRLLSKAGLVERWHEVLRRYPLCSQFVRQGSPAAGSRNWFVDLGELGDSTTMSRAACAKAVSEEPETVFDFLKHVARWISLLLVNLSAYFCGSVRCE